MGRRSAGLPENHSFCAGAGAHSHTITCLLVKTDNSALCQSSEFQPTYVALTPDSCDWLIEHCIDVIGWDYLSVEPFGAPTPEVHHKLCGAGVVIIEGLNLSAVEAGAYELIWMPLLIEGADGASARVALRTP